MPKLATSRLSTISYGVFVYGLGSLCTAFMEKVAASQMHSYAAMIFFKSPHQVAEREVHATLARNHRRELLCVGSS